MIYVLTTLHVIVCLFLIGVVLLQTGKRADLAGAFGGGGSQTAFGTRGAATFLTKLTTGFAVMFMLTTITLSVVSFRASSGGGGSVLDDIPAAQTAPADTSGDAAPPIEADVPEGDGTAPGALDSGEPAKESLPVDEDDPEEP